MRQASTEPSRASTNCRTGLLGARVLLAAWRRIGTASLKYSVRSWKYRYAMGRMETDADGCSLREVEQKFAASGGQFKELLVALTLTDSFRYRPAVPEAM